MTDDELRAVLAKMGGEDRVYTFAQGVFNFCVYTLWLMAAAMVVYLFLHGVK